MPVTRASGQPAPSLPTPPIPPEVPGVLTLLALLALTAPTLLGYSSSPAVTFLNEVVSLFGWGLLCCVAIWYASKPGVGLSFSRGAWALPVVAVVLMGGAAASAHLWALPTSLALATCGALAAAWLVFWVGTLVGQSAIGRQAFKSVCIALFTAGVCGLLIGLIQAFRPGWCDGTWLASTTVAGKAIGNLRQPNHLATLLVWAIAAAVWLTERGWPRLVMMPLMLGMVYAVLLTASRTGMVGVGFFAIWALLDRQLTRPMRALLLLLPVFYAACWGGMFALAHLNGQAFAAEARLHSGSDISSSRFPVWRDTWVLIQQHPLTGVGLGNFNFAWTLTPFPQRSIHFFDHTHNILIQFAVELGLPATALISALLLAALIGLVEQALGGTEEAPGTAPAAIGTPAARTALFIVVMVGWHSLLEYPLWYAYFLLPTVFIWGLALAPSRPARGAAGNPPGNAGKPSVRAGVASAAPAGGLHGPMQVVLFGASALLSLGSIVALGDYLRVTEIYQPSANAGPLDDRIAIGQKSWFFDYQAEYAAATTPEEDEPSPPLETFRKPLHHLIDTRLLAAYARALHEHGDDLRAYFVVDRLREFTRLAPTPDAFLKVCSEPAPDTELPFQCLAGPAGRDKLDYRDFLPRPDALASSPGSGGGAADAANAASTPGAPGSPGSSAAR